MKNSRTPRLSDLIRQPPATRPETSAGHDVPDEPPSSVESEGALAAARAAEPQETRPRPSLLSAPEAEARIDYELLEQWIASLFERASNGVFDPDDILDNVRAILDRPKLLDALFAETFKTMKRGEPLARKSLNVAIYALRLGSALRYEGDSLVRLGVAAILHKIGLARVPPELIAKPGVLSRSEFSVVRQHPQIGRDLVAPRGGPFAEIAEIIYEANERIDGSGYPRGLEGEDIRPESLIIGLVDVFEALIQPRPYRERVVPFRATKEIIERERARFPRTLLREFIASFSVFPPFTYVRLNSKAIARVLETEPGYPLRPQVAVVIDPGGNRLENPPTLRLRESPLLYITAPVGEEELAV